MRRRLAGLGALPAAHSAMMVPGSLQRRNVLNLAALVVVAILCLALLAEGVVRVRSYLRHGYSSPRIESIYQIDPETGLRIPVPSGRMGGIEINSLGFRGDELENPKPSGRIRLAFLGGSATFCAEVSNNSVAWPHLVTQLLNEKFGYKRFDYVNAAVPGYSLEASRARFAAEVAALDPDVVVIYHASNDLSKNSAREAERQGILVNRGDAGLSFPAKYSMLWYLAQKNIRIWQGQRRAFDPAAKLDVSLDALVKPFADDLDALVSEAKAVADTVILVTFATRLRRGQSEEELRKAAVTSLYYMPYMTPDQLLSAFEAYNSVMRTVATTSGAFLVDEIGTLPADEANFVDSIHFTDRGSQKMAERVYRGLLNSGALARYL
jgi:lysophospholipase L1-like esterase